MIYQTEADLAGLRLMAQAALSVRKSTRGNKKKISTISKDERRKRTAKRKMQSRKRKQSKH